MSSLPLVSVVIVNWNGRRWLEQCLPTVAAQTYPRLEIIVVDNGSTDGSVAWLAQSWPDVRVLPLAANVGFAPANNRGIAAARGALILTLNNDTLLEADCMAQLVAAMADAGIGMAAPQILLWRDPARLDSAGIEVDWAGFAWQRGHGQAAKTADAPQDVFGPSAAAALYRRDLLCALGGFDDAFFAYYEDVDLAWRLQRAGWRCRYAPAARVRHWHSATGGQNEPFKQFLLGRNRWWALLKNYPLPRLLWTWPLLLALDGTAVIRQMLRLRSLAPLNGRWQALRGAGQIWRRRTRARSSAPLAPLLLTSLPSRITLKQFAARRNQKET